VQIRRIHPYVESADPAATSEFYRAVFGLEVAMTQPVVDLVSPHAPSAQLIITPQGMETPQHDFGIDVGDASAVDTVHQRIRELGMRVVYPLTNEPWDVRRFFFQDPDRRIVNVLAHLDGRPA
jgi:catechol 2,3-dioxygenase-like lactoylglutathione lyase family enzyme